VSRARNVVDVVARSLVDRPDEVMVTEVDQKGTMVIEVRVGRDDLGRLIGRQGRTATAIRTLAAATAEQEGLTVDVEFRDDRDHR
jgi:uncharacterized protein